MDMSRELTIKDMEGYMKGDLAESMVARVFRAMGFLVKYNGVENAHPEFVYFKEADLIDPSLVKEEYFRPDFIVLKPKDDIHPKGFKRDIEVKFRKNGKLERTAFAKYPEGIHFILVDNEHFWSVSNAKINREQEGSAKIQFNLLVRLEDDLDYQFSAEQKAIIDRYKPYLQFIGKLSLSNS